MDDGVVATSLTRSVHALPPNSGRRGAPLGLAAMTRGRHRTPDGAWRGRRRSASSGPTSNLEVDQLTIRRTLKGRLGHEFAVDTQDTVGDSEGAADFALCVDALRIHRLRQAEEARGGERLEGCSHADRDSVDQRNLTLDYHRLTVKARLWLSQVPCPLAVGRDSDAANGGATPLRRTSTPR